MNTVYDFSVDYGAIGKIDILNIYEYLMKKNNIKLCLHLLNRPLLHSYVLVDH